MFVVFCLDVCDVNGAFFAVSKINWHDCMCCELCELTLAVCTSRVVPSFMWVTKYVCVLVDGVGYSSLF